MFGWKLIRESELLLMKQMADMELKLAVARALHAETYAAKWEGIVSHERERIDHERERADRIADSLFQSSGLPPVSPVVIAEEKEKQHETKMAQQDYEKAMKEIFDETFDDFTSDADEGVVVPPTP